LHGLLRFVFWRFQAPAEFVGLSQCQHRPEQALPAHLEALSGAPASAEDFLLSALLEKQMARWYRMLTRWHPGVQQP
jgi:uncharacterized protein YfaQ (DUF2300 family)